MLSLCDSIIKFTINDLAIHYSILLGLIMGHCMKKKCYENLQSLIEIKKHQSVKCFAEYEVIRVCDKREV